MGTEYQIIVEGTWEQIAEVARMAKKAIKNTQPTWSHFSRGDDELENRTLEAYLVPQDGENFGDYKARFNQVFAGTGIIGKLASFLNGNKVPFYFHLTQNEGESTFRVDSITREGRYQATVSVSGNYSDRGASMVEDLRNSLKQIPVEVKYHALEKLV